MSITTAYVKAFGSNIQMLAQQVGSRLRNTVTVESGVVGEKKFVDQVAKMTATKKMSRIAPTPIVEPTFNRRMVTMYTWEHVPVYDTIYDLQKMLADPKSKLTMSAVAALGRALDGAVIEAASAAALTGKEGTTSVALPSASKIAVASAGLTIAKLLTAREKIRSAGTDESDPLFCVASEKQFTNLLGTTQVTSADYNSVKALVNGDIDTFLGFKFIHSELLGLVTTSTRAVLAYAKSGISLCVGKDINVDVSVRNDLSLATQIYSSMTIGASRLEEEKVVEIACLES